MEKTFVFDGYEDNEMGEIVFHYRIKSDAEELTFAEKLTFPNADFSKVPADLLKNLLDNLSLVLGISYWKLYCPQKIEIKNNQLTKEQADFWNTVYTKGLGEFFYRNNIDFRGIVQFPYTKGTNAEPVAFTRNNRSLLMLGGGKDSIVAAELLKAQKKDFTVFVVNEYPLQKEIIKLLNINSIIIKREIDPKLLKYNKQGTYNGHVPISAIYAFLGILSAALYDFRYIISSNEKSANYGNVTYLGETINHQWSKSFEFEELFQAYVSKFITPNIVYFSLLRPLYEIKIAQVFTNYTKYFSSFSSCNRNFTIKKKLNRKWCGECPKCAFIFAILAAFLSKNDVVTIFGKNLLADKSLQIIFQELLGIKNSKPFECVGTPDEMQLALYLVYKHGEFNNDYIMEMFIKDVLPKVKDVEKLEKELLSVSSEDMMRLSLRKGAE